MKTERPDRKTIVLALGAIAGVSFLALLFIASYSGALHEPKPHGVQIAATEAVPSTLVKGLESGGSYDVSTVSDRDAALTDLDERNVYAALVPAAKGVELIVAPAASSSIVDVITGSIPKELKSQGTPVKVTTVHPLPKSDARGLVGFYTVVGWAIAGYLGATLFGLVFGTHPGLGRVAWRMGALSLLSLIVGFGGAAVSTAFAGYDDGFLKMVLVGFLTVMATGTITVALQQFLGIIGTGVAILLFVVFANPAAGGAFGTELLPGIWRELGPFTPAGAATDALRSAAFFPKASIGSELLVLIAWIVVGLGASAAAARWGRGISEDSSKASLAGVA